MTADEIVAVIEKHLIRAVDDVDEGTLDPEKKFTDYGANSLDIVEVVSASMRELKVKIPRPELANIENIGQLVDKFEEYVSES